MTAEERALEVYPIAMSQYSDNCKEYDSNESDRLTFIEGYRQAEKDLAPTAQDRGLAEEIIIHLKRVEKDYRIDLTREIEWLRNKTKKGK